MRVETAPSVVSKASVPPTPAIEARNLHFHYDTSDGQIHDISFSIAEGECVGLIGPNGAGKSTLLMHLNGVLPETFSGEPNVFIFGQGVTAKTLHAIRRDVGLLFQDPDDQLFCPTVFDDVAFGPKQFGLSKEEVTQRVRTSLAEVGLSHLEDRPPHFLSGGEKRRVCLAGVLACQPRILVLDEPTTNLDPRARRELKALLRRIPATKLVASHDLDLILELCPRTLLLDGGQIVSEGDTREMLGNEELMFSHGLEKPASLT